MLFFVSFKQTHIQTYVYREAAIVTSMNGVQIGLVELRDGGDVGL